MLYSTYTQHQPNYNPCRAAKTVRGCGVAVEFEIMQQARMTLAKSPPGTTLDLEVLGQNKTKIYPKRLMEFPSRKCRKIMFFCKYNTFKPQWVVDS